MKVYLILLEVYFSSISERDRERGKERPNPKQGLEATVPSPFFQPAQISGKDVSGIFREVSGLEPETFVSEITPQNITFYCCTTIWQLRTFDLDQDKLSSKVCHLRSC